MSTLTGTFQMARLTARRSRLFWTLWILGLAYLMPATAGQYNTMIPPGTGPALTLGPLITNPSMLALLGPAFFDVSSKAGFVFWRVGGFASLLAGMMGCLAIIRATRAEEEEGCLELLRSGAIGRHAPLAGALLTCTSGCLLLGVVSTSGAVGAGLPAVGAVAAGAASACEGLVFVGLGALAAQMVQSARTARLWALGAAWGGLLVVRMMVDGSGPDTAAAWLGWVNPLEWGMYLRPWSGERWWVLALPAAFVVVAVAVAFRLESLRDHEAGLLPPRRGPADAPAWLAGAWSLGWRLQRGSLTAWGLALVTSSAAIGSIGPRMREALASNSQAAETLQSMGGSGDLLTTFYVAMTGITSTVSTVMALALLSRLRAEETQGRAEVVLATATSRWRLAGSHLVPALVGSCLTSLASGAVMPLVQAQHDGDWEMIGRYLGTAAGLLPGVVLVVGVAVMLLGWLPRWTGLAWVLLGWSVCCTWFAVLLDLPGWLLRLQPWGHLSHLPEEPMNWLPFTLELALGAGLIVLGLVGYRRRSVPA